MRVPEIYVEKIQAKARDRNLADEHINEFVNSDLSLNSQGTSRSASMAIAYVLTAEINILAHIRYRRKRLYLPNHDVAIMDFVWKRVRETIKPTREALSRTASQDSSNGFLINLR